MLASELIQRLQASIDTYGDVPVIDEDEAEIDTVTYNEDDDPVFILET